jgi:hypothetical protein
MSPAKHRQQTSSAKNGSKMKHGGYGGMCLPVFKWNKKERRAQKAYLTGARGVSKADFSHFWRVLEHLNVTCETSKASIVSKE